MPSEQPSEQPRERSLNQIRVSLIIQAAKTKPDDDDAPCEPVGTLAEAFNKKFDTEYFNPIAQKAEEAIDSDGDLVAILDIFTTDLTQLLERPRKQAILNATCNAIKKSALNETSTAFEMVCNQWVERLSTAASIENDAKLVTSRSDKPLTPEEIFQITHKQYSWWFVFLRMLEERPRTSKWHWLAPTLLPTLDELCIMGFFNISPLYPIIYYVAKAHGALTISTHTIITTKAATPIVSTSVGFFTTASLCWVMLPLFINFIAMFYLLTHGNKEGAHLVGALNVSAGIALAILGLSNPISGIFLIIAMTISVMIALYTFFNHDKTAARLSGLRKTKNVDIEQQPMCEYCYPSEFAVVCISVLAVGILSLLAAKGATLVLATLFISSMALILTLILAETLIFYNICYLLKQGETKTAWTIATLNIVSFMLIITLGAANPISFCLVIIIAAVALLATLRVSKRGEEVDNPSRGIRSNFANDRAPDNTTSSNDTSATWHPTPAT